MKTHLFGDPAVNSFGATPRDVWRFRRLLGDAENHSDAEMAEGKALRANILLWMPPPFARELRAFGHVIECALL